MNSLDEKLKQRLVGAIVLTALVVIFLPMLFDEQVSDRSVSSRMMPEFPVEFDENIPTLLSEAEIKDKIAQTQRQSSEQVTRTQGLKSWNIQIGSFVKKTNAKSLRDKLREAGFAAFVETVGKADKLRFRVRVGPELSLKRAEQVKKSIEAKFNTKALLVIHP